MLKKLGRFRARPLAERLLILEAALFIGVARAAIRALPFRWLAAWLTSRQASRRSRADPVSRRELGRAIAVAARNVPWNAVCLPQAIAAKLMLARRGYSSTLHFGAARSGGDRMIAHAWLEADGDVIVGEAGVAQVTPLARFG